MVYEALINTVTRIVRRNGEDIITSPKFWHILADSYSFMTEPSLKNAFRAVLKDGAMDQLVAVKGNRKRSIDKIEEIVSSQTTLNGHKEEYLWASLFSVAIALGSCTKTDYEDFLKGHTALTSTTISPITSPKSSSTSTSSISSSSSSSAPLRHPPKGHKNLSKFIGTTIGIISLALAIQIISLLTYGLFLFKGLWMLGVLIILMLIQFFYTAFTQEWVIKIKDKVKRGYVGALYIGSYWALNVNILISLLFQFKGIRCWAYMAFSNEIILPENLDTILEASQLSNFMDESPGFFSIILAIAVPCCIQSVITNFQKRIKYKIQFSGLISGASFLALLVLGTVTVSGYMVSRRSFEERELRRQERIIDQEMTRLREHNEELINLRAANHLSLSFKGITLDCPFTLAKREAEQVIRQDTSISPYFNLLESNYTAKLNVEEEWAQSFRQAKTMEKNTSKWGTGVFNGEHLKFDTTLDNEEVYVEVFEMEGKVLAILVTPKIDILNVDLENYNEGFKNFPTLINLYTQKYGDPETIHDRDYFKGLEPIHEKTLRWTFPNGVVQINEEYIIYVDSSFFTLKERIAQRMRLWKAREDSIKREAKKADSIRQLHNRRKTLNEI